MIGCFREMIYSPSLLFRQSPTFVVTIFMLYFLGRASDGHFFFFSISYIVPLFHLW